MQLNRAGLADKSAWEAKGYALPSFDYETVKKNTKEKSILGSLRCWQHLPCIPVQRCPEPFKCRCS